MQAQFTDHMTADGALKQTADGWAVQARVARGGNVQVYASDEMGIEGPRHPVRVYRPADAVFDRKAIETYARKPITLGHPQGGVTPESWKDLAIGEVDRDVMRDGEFVSVPLLFRDAKAVESINRDGGPRELSMGYSADLEFADGVSPAGETYDAIMSGFRMNHVAVVGLARGGSQCRIGDGADKWGASPLTVADMKEKHMTLRKVMVDGLEVETTDAGAAAIDKLTKTIAAKDEAIAKAAADAKAAIDAKDGEIATKDAAIEKLQKAQMSDADIDARVAARASLVDIARKIDPDLKFDGLTDAAIRKAVVVAKLGDEKTKDRPDAYIDARFEILAEDAASQAAGDDPLKTVLADSKHTHDTLDKAYADRRAEIANAWQTPAKKEA